MLVYTWLFSIIGVLIAEELKNYKSTFQVHTKCRNSKMIALTFDDGIIPSTTDVLDILKRNRVSATFFVVGYTIDQNPMYRKVLHRILNSGHTIGGHSYSHADLTQLSQGEIIDELERTADIIESATGERPKFVRPPFGYTNDVVVKVICNQGYEIVNWNLDTNDWRYGASPSSILDALAAKEGSYYKKDKVVKDSGMSSKIVLMHDRPLTVDFLDSGLMPRGASTVCASKCAHFDVNKSDCGYFTLFRKVKAMLLINGLKPTARQALLSKFPELLNNKGDEIKCGSCDSEGAKGPLYMCLTCSWIGCWSEGNSGSCHVKAHLTAEHPLAMEMRTGMIYCFGCNLFIWNAAMELFVKSPDAFDEQKLTISTSSPSKKKKNHINDNVGPLNEALKNHCISMRGMVNLGNTCFMASVLQVLLHCKQLRAFFMSLGHDSKNCTRRTLKSTNNICMACEFDDLFNLNYCGEMSPYAPTQFLHAMWGSSKHLSGYEQQDAHEFLISILGQIHTDLGGSTFACKCPVHSSFTGVLQSDVTCLACGNVNASFDPFMDVSLDILTSSNDSGFILDPNTASLSLHECFHMFTHAERLSSNTYICATCNHTYQEATKQLSIRKAPQILTIHLKRFEHSLNTVKIDTFMEFPLEFSIFDYTTEGVHLNNELRKISSFGGMQTPNLIDPTYEMKKYSKDMLYRLVATVNHTGVVDSGHYISYIISEDADSHGNWFKFDDAMVTKVSTATVLSSNAYMLFYERVGTSQPSGSSEDPVFLD